MLSLSHTHLVAMFALRAEFNSNFEGLAKTGRMIAAHWSAMHRKQSDCF